MNMQGLRDNERTEAYLDALDKWVRCRVCWVHEDGNVDVQVMFGPAERIIWQVPVLRLRVVEAAS